MSRIGALLAYEKREGASVEWCAANAGVSVPRFFVLLREWRENPVLASVVPHAKARKTQVDAEDGDDVRIQEHVLSNITADPGLTKEQLALALQRDMGPAAPSLSLLRRRVDLVLGKREREAAGGREGFGRRTLIDSTAVAVPVLVAPETVDWLTVGLAVDVATTMVLGHAVGRHRNAVDLNHATARNAIGFLRGLDLPLRPWERNAESPAFTVVIGEDSVVAVLHEADRLMSVPAELEIVHQGGDRRYGSRLVRLLGRSLGSLDLRPRFASPKFRARRSRSDAAEQTDLQPLSEVEAANVVAEEIRRHNATVMKISPRASLAPEAVASGLDTIFPEGLI